MRLRAAGVLNVIGDLTLTEVEVRLRISRTRLNSRGELTAVASGRTSSRDGDIVARQTLRGRLASGQQAGFDVAVNLDDVETLQEFGVHVLNVEVVARSREGLARAAIVRTFLPWVPARRDFKPAGFTWLWPLVAPPVQLADGRYVDDSLSGEMAAEGRLGRITTAGSRLGQQMPLTWVVDPALLETAEDMSDGYTVRAEDPTQPAVDGTGAATAQQWLDQVRAASRLGDVATLPYADPDVVALRRSGLTSDVLAARGRGDAMAAELLGRDVVTDLAWPADGYADRPTLRTLRSGGTQAVVLTAAAIPTELALPFTPTGRVDIGTRDGRLTGLLYDPVLTATLGARRQPAAAAGGPAVRRRDRHDHRGAARHRPGADDPDRAAAELVAPARAARPDRQRQPRGAVDEPGLGHRPAGQHAARDRPRAAHLSPRDPPARAARSPTSTPFATCTRPSRRSPQSSPNRRRSCHPSTLRCSGSSPRGGAPTTAGSAG